MRKLLMLLGILWASPWTLLGIAVGLIGLMTGGRFRRVEHTLEFYGGLVTPLLKRLPVNPIAMTLGHTILGVSSDALDVVRDHEWVHVRQYARWGPLFGPAYLLCSAVLWLRGKDGYRDNPFEREAYSEAG